MRLQNKIALITGAARGIGFAIARRFLDEGAHVALADITESSLVEARERLGGGKGKILIVPMNVAKREDVEAGVALVEKELGHIDILINNAGITRDAMLHKMSDEQWDQVIDVNLKGVYLCGNVVGSRMRERGTGSIVNTSSVVGLYGNIGQTNYAATKAGVIAMTKTWARELGRKGVRVNAIAPGYTMTEMMSTVPEKVLAMMAEKTPVGRLAQPEEIAAAFAFLASDDSSYVNGHVLSVDGGLVL